MSSNPSDRPMAPAYPHGELEEVLQDIFMVRGSLQFKKPPMRFSRNMVVVRHGGDLTLINTIRLDEAGLASLEALGTVKHVIRIAGFHGMDDRFYRERYHAQIWMVRGQIYARSLKLEGKDPAKGYMQPDHHIDADTELPIPGAKPIVIPGAVPEGLVYLEGNGGTLVTGDCLQNWRKADAYFNLVARIGMRLMGFIKAFNVGPGWITGAKPNKSAFTSLLDLSFENVLPGHGDPVIGGARDAFRPAIERAARKMAD